MVKLAKGAKAQGKPKKAPPPKQVDSSEDEEMEESEEELIEVPVKTPSKKATTPAKATPGKKAATPAKAAATPGKKRATPAAAKNGKKAKKAKKEESEEDDEESELFEEDKPAANKRVAKKDESEENDDKDDEEEDDDNDNDDGASMLTSGEKSVVAAALVFVAARLLEERRPKRKRRMWTRSWVLKRSTLSHMGLIRELRDNNPHDFRNYLRMSEESFKIILAAVTPLTQRRNTPMCAAVSVEERLAVTLRFLATGRSLRDLQFSAAVSRPLLSVMIPETCEAIVQSLRHYMEFPKTADDWKKIASDFEQLWQFPNCGGALDGKHVRITQPANSGSFFYNYKGYFSLILMALVNANYEFVDVDVGMNGRVSDGGVLEHTSFGEGLRNNQLQLPQNEDTKGNLNFVFIADEAFPLHPHLLKSFAQRTLTAERRIYNYRLSRARCVVENAFGIMANRFRVFHTAINLKLPSIDLVVLACCVLHNFLRRHDTSSYSPPSFIDSVDPRTGDIVPGEWRTQEENLAGLQALGSGRQADDARDCREKYCLYFNGSGAVPWQDHAV
ncbi:uncharacterized protein LOC143807995 isoform X1 [Ranitomeya variabilis]|uniref:uncharacterized protein LOC143807995 isoform X1 n=1 Tax=Ranitomeya variabilis TaxID=490064 RepID=UPI004055C2F9